MVHSAERGIVGVTKTESATMVAWAGLRGAGYLAGQVVDMYERHGDVALFVSRPILEGYGNRVRSILGEMG